MKLLIIAAEFPPVNTTGSYRTARFVKHFREQGIEPVVIGIEPGDASAVFHRPIHETPEPQDFKRYDFPCKISKPASKIGFVLGNYFAPYDRIGEAFLKNKPALLDIISKEKPDLIYVSAPPFSMLNVAYALSKASGVPYVIDMRDAWAYWTSAPHYSKFHFLFKKRLEHKFFREAKAIIGVTPELVNIFREAHPGIAAGKFHVVANGFDTLPEQLQLAEAAGTPDIRVGYIGSFYYSPEEERYKHQPFFRKPLHRWLEYRPLQEDWKYRSPFYFLKAVQRLKELRPELAARFKIEFIGDHPAWLKRMVQDLGLQEQVYYHGFQTRQAIYDIVKSWDYLLATSEKVIGGRHYCLPSKLFDYYTFGKPILGFVTEGDQLDFLEHAGNSLIFNPDTPDDNALRMIQLFAENPNFSINLDYLKEYSGKRLAGKLATILKHL